LWKAHRLGGRVRGAGFSRVHRCDGHGLDGAGDWVRRGAASVPCARWVGLGAGAAGRTLGGACRRGGR
jgi:hypothetical protein